MHEDTFQAFVSADKVGDVAEHKDHVDHVELFRLLQ